MLPCIHQTQTQLRQAKLTSIVKFHIVHHCTVNDLFGYKYHKQSSDHSHFRPILRHTRYRIICLCRHLQLYFFRCFLFFSFRWARHRYIFIIFVIRKSCYPFPRSNIPALLFWIRFFSTPTPQFFKKTWSTDSLNISLLTVSFDINVWVLVVYRVDIFHCTKTWNKVTSL